MRRGSACISDSGSTPSRMPMMPKNRPQAARLNATGKPISMNRIRPANMIGARFWAMNWIIVVLLRGSGLLVAFGQAPDLLGQFLLGGLGRTLHRGVGDQAAQEGNALDQF